MKIKKFTQLKDSIQNLFLSEEDKTMNYYIEYMSLEAVVEKLNSGYKLNEEQDYNLKKVISINNKSLWDVEKVFEMKLPQKYIYSMVIDNYPQMLLDIKNQDKLESNPLFKNWLISQNQNDIADNVFRVWMENIENVISLKKGNEEVKNTVEIFDKFQSYVPYLNENTKTEVIDFLRTKINSLNMMHYSNAKEYLNKTILILKKTESSKEIDNLQTHLTQLKEQNEESVFILAKEVEEQYKTLFKHIKDMDTFKKEAVIKLAEHFNNNISHYLSIKKDFRNKRVNNKSAQELIHETLNDIKQTVEENLKQIQEVQLMNLSSKKRYVSELKNQW